jgi:hypothetical protein
MAEIRDELILGIIRNHSFSFMAPAETIEHNDMLVVAEYTAVGE